MEKIISPHTVLFDRKPKREFQTLQRNVASVNLNSFTDTFKNSKLSPYSPLILNLIVFHSKCFIIGLCSQAASSSVHQLCQVFSSYSRWKLKLELYRFIGFLLHCLSTAKCLPVYPLCRLFQSHSNFSPLSTFSSSSVALCNVASL